MMLAAAVLGCGVCSAAVIPAEGPGQIGYSSVVLGDSEDSLSGWVDSSYLAVDPAWYQTDEDTPVYAWDDTSAPKVALLEGGTSLPILKDNGDWLIVSLRGATGWVNLPNRTASVSTDTRKSDTAVTSSSGNAAGSASGTSQPAADQGTWFTVISRDGDIVSIHPAGGAMYEDASGRTYVKQDEDAFYYCITMDVTYALDATMWTGEAFGENEFPND